MAPLVEWKTKKGVPAKSFLLDDIIIDPLYHGRDNAERLHNFLQDLKSKSKLQWILLVGDSEIMPTRLLNSTAKIYNMDDNYISDLYYAGLNTDWDSDNDGNFGEEGEEAWNGQLATWTPSAYVGRLPVNTVSETQIVVSKILDYELDYERVPPSGDWAKKMSLWGGLMDAPNVGAYDPDQDNAFEVKEKVFHNDLPGHLTISKYYDYPFNYSGVYSPAVDNLNHMAVTTEFNQGL